MVAYLLYPQRNNASATAHDVAVTSTTNLGPLRTNRTRFGYNHLFHHRLRCTHRVHRISRLIGTQAYNTLHAFFYRSRKDILSAKHIGFNCFYRKELARRHLFQSRSMEYVINSMHCILNRSQVTHIANIESDLLSHLRHLRLIFMAHIILFLLITRENTNLSNIRTQESIHYRMSETAGPTGDQ